jgi:lipoteichoic acid synthase
LGETCSIISTADLSSSLRMESISNELNMQDEYCKMNIMLIARIKPVYLNRNIGRASSDMKLYFNRRPGNILGSIKAFFVGNIEVFIFILIIFGKSILFNKVIGLKYDNTLIRLSCLGSVLILTGLCMWMKRKTRIITLTALDVIITLIMISDMLYNRYFNDVISTPVLSQIVLMDSLGHSIGSLFRRVDLLFIADIVIALPIIAFLIKSRRLVEMQKTFMRFIVAIVVLILGLNFTVSGFKEVNKAWDNRAFTYVFDHTYFVEKLGVLNFHGFDVYSFISDKLFNTNRVTEEEKGKIKAAFADQAIVKAKMNGAYKGYNLIVVQVEALQNIVINMKINGQEVTPNLNKLAGKSIYFKNYYSQAVQGSTADAEFLSNVSFYPMTAGAVYFHYPHNTFLSMPKVLKKDGYDTMAMHAYKASFWNRANIYPIMGFNNFYSMKDYNIDDVIGWGLSDKSFLKQSLDKMKKSKKPFYSFLVTLSSHHPYDALKDSMDLNVGQYEGTFYGNYLKAVHYTDEALGEFINGLQKEGLLDKSIVAIYGDHAALQKERLNDMKKELKLNNNNELGWMQMIKVPLIVHLPKDNLAGTRSNAGGQVDLFPTLANLLGVDAKYALGKDLLNTDKNFVILRDGSIIDGKYVYLKNQNECFEIASGKKMGKNVFEKYVGESQKQLSISDKVIENNLIPYLEEKAGK